jgi:LysR family nitrogen assimilation transcriptional regulator
LCSEYHSALFRPFGSPVINLRQLRYFVRVVEVGNLTRAAALLFIAQPALGAQMRQLESALGVSLLERHSRGVSPTPAGSMLYERACEIIRLVDETEHGVRALGGAGRERIVLGLTNGLISFIGREITLAVAKQLPGIELQLVEEMSFVLADRVERGEIDLALAYEIAERPGLLRVPLLEEELLFISAPGSGDTDAPIEFSALADRRLVLPDRRDGTHQLLRASGQRIARELDVVREVSSVAATRELVAHGDADSVMPFASASDDLDRGRLHGRRIVNPCPLRTLYLLRAARRAPSAQEPRLLDLLGPFIQAFAKRLGALAHPLSILDTPLSEALAKAPAQA